MSEEEAGEAEEQEEEGGAGGGQDIMDMLPRTDVRWVAALGLSWRSGCVLTLLLLQ